MHPDTRQIAEHMRHFGLSLFGRSLHDATFSELTKPYAHAVAVVTAAQAGEILLKARIAQEHPRLVFKSLPSSGVTDDVLTLEELFKHGHSYGYDQLPELLWATTGIRLEHLSLYRDFGKLRNAITHFAVPQVDLPAETLRYCVEFLYPLTRQFWNEHPLKFAEDWYEDILTEGYLEYALLIHAIPISKEFREELGPESEANGKRMFDDVQALEAHPAAKRKWSEGKR